MSQTYRKPIPVRTQSTFADDVHPSRATNIRRDTDKVTSPVITPDHLNKAIRMLITDIIMPHVEYQGETIPVPVFYASAENWSTIQANGVMRDEKNRIMLPLIVYKCDSIEDRKELERQNMLPNDPDVGVQFAHRRYSPQNQYDQFSTMINAKPKVEYYAVTTPDYVKASYTITIWTELVDQLNKIIESFMFNERTAKMPYPYRFINVIDSCNFETVNNTGEDKIAKCVISMSLFGFLIPEYDSATYQMNVKKTLSTRKVIITTEGVASLDDIPRT